MENALHCKSKDRTTEMLHLMASFDTKRGLYAFFCEGQPLMTVRSNGLPSRCPVCGMENPLSRDSNNYSPESQEKHRRPEEDSHLCR